MGIKDKVKETVAKVTAGKKKKTVVEEKVDQAKAVVKKTVAKAKGMKK